MRKGQEKIDLLLERNAAEQLRRIDWDELSSGVSRRINEAELAKERPVIYGSFFKVAAGVAAAAAMVLIAIMIRTSLPSGQRQTAVKLVHSKSTVTVQIEPQADRAAVTVSIEPGSKQVAKCEVEIIDLNGGRKKQETQAAWIIISRREPLLVYNGASRDMTNIMCLF